MLLDTNKISLIYDFWKLNTEDNYLQDATELSRKLTESNLIDGKCDDFTGHVSYFVVFFPAKYIQDWIPDLVYFIELWEQELLTELDDF